MNGSYDATAHCNIATDAQNEQHKEKHHGKKLQLKNEC